MTTYSNPRMEAVVENWPSGRNRVTAKFVIEVDTKNRRERACRTTTGETKKLTYAHKARIVDGDDGRTYIVEMSSSGGHIRIMRGDMKFQHETAFPQKPRYTELCNLFSQGAPT
jgi:hypothetical protein